MPNQIDGRELERRCIGAHELRAVDGGGDDRRRVEGYAAVFDQWSDDLGGFREIIRTGAFSQTIQVDDIRMVWNHNTDEVLGRNQAGTLELEEDDVGLRFVDYPPEGAEGRVESIERGDVDQMSFLFTAERDEWHKDEDGNWTRELLQVRIYEISPVVFPAYPQTSAQVRSRLEELKAAASADGDQVDETAGDGDGQAQGRLDRMRRRLALLERE